MPRDPEKLKANNRRYYARNPEKWQAYQRARYAADPIAYLYYSNNRAAKRLGYAPIVDALEDVRTIAETATNCAICGREAKLKIDHSHQDGAFRGMLCDRCNRGLGLFGDSPETLIAASEYLHAS